LRSTLLGALLHARQREITGTLVDLVIATVHRIGARAATRPPPQDRARELLLGRRSE
jgi:hypothetical protein